MVSEAALNGRENTSENSSHLNASGSTSLALRALAERDHLRSHVRATLGFLRDLQKVAGGPVLAKLIEEGELLLDGVRS